MIAKEIVIAIAVAVTITIALATALSKDTRLKLELRKPTRDSKCGAASEQSSAQLFIHTRWKLTFHHNCWNNQYLS